MGPVEEKILLLLKEGDRRYTEIVNETGHAHKVVWDALTRLRDGKFIRPVKRGVYGITERGAALLLGGPYALYKLQLEVRIAGSCFEQHVGYVRKGARPEITAYAIDSFSIASLADAIQTLLEKVAGSLRTEIIDLPRAWSCDLGSGTTMDQYFVHFTQHLANVKRLSAALRGLGPELERTSEVSDDLVGRAETALGRLKEGWQKDAFDNVRIL